MDRDLLTPGDRVRWAIDQCGKTLEEIGDAIGCSHSALSQWQTGVTNLHNVKVGLIFGFSRETGASIDWLLTGDGPRLSAAGRQRVEHPLIAAARHIVDDLPQHETTAQRLLAALEPPPPPYR